MSINCEAPAGPVHVVATEANGSWTSTVQLSDGNHDHDQEDRDGIFTGILTPGSASEFELKFYYGSGGTEVAGDAVTVRVVDDAPAEPAQELACEPPETRAGVMEA
jgi:hypothetical protein